MALSQDLRNRQNGHYIIRGTGSVVYPDPDSMGSLDPDPYSQAGFGSRRTKMFSFEGLIKASPVAWTSLRRPRDWD